ncbi:MAG: phosphotransferase family protein [Actinobacteria bacterium]|nr:MAG: phosphotransferase family protein [Actinomycetota bacterium]
MTAADDAGLDPSVLDWIRRVTDASTVRAERRVGGASREGYAIDAVLADGTTRALWLRMDAGFGAQSQGVYTLRREAAVYRALAATPVRVATLVAVHPTIEAFLMERLEGRNWFSEITDPQQQVALASAFMRQLAELHRLDPRDLALPELGAPDRVSRHVIDEIDIWDEQYRRQGEPDPVAVLALSWLRRHLPPDDDWPVVLVQGDTGPGNFMYRDSEIVAVTDWEMAHLGDLHDDLGWIYVRDLQERFPHMPDRLRDYEQAGGRRVDPDRLRYFRVLAQTRCAIGTRNGVLVRDRRGEVANQLIYNTLHTRLLVEALADAAGARLVTAPMPDTGDTANTWVYDVALDELRELIVPNIVDGFASRRAKGMARLVKYLRELDRLGAAAQHAELTDLNDLLGHECGDLAAARGELCDAIDAGAIGEERVLEFCARQSARETQLMRPAMGALADRHYAPID